MRLRTLDKKTLLSAGTASGRVRVSQLSVLRDGRSVIATTVAGTATVDIEAYFSESQLGTLYTVNLLQTDGSIMIRDDHGHYEKIRAKSVLTHLELTASTLLVLLTLYKECHYFSHRR